MEINYRVYRNKIYVLVGDIFKDARKDGISRQGISLTPVGSHKSDPFEAQDNFKKDYTPPKSVKTDTTSIIN